MKKVEDTEENGEIGHIASTALFNASDFQWDVVKRVRSLPRLPIGAALTTAAATRSLAGDHLGGNVPDLGRHQSSVADKVRQIGLPDHPAEIAPWELPFQTPEYWQALESAASVRHSSGQ